MLVYIRLHKSCHTNVHVHASCPSLRSILLAVLGLSVEIPGFSETNKLDQIGGSEASTQIRGYQSCKQVTWMRPPSHCSSLRLALCWDLREVTAGQLLSNPEISWSTMWRNPNQNLWWNSKSRGVALDASCFKPLGIPIKDRRIIPLAWAIRSSMDLVRSFILL